MARLSTAAEGSAGSVFYTYSATPGSGQGTALRSALNTNLLLTTVSALVTFGAGATERNYTVLSNKKALPITVDTPSGTFTMLETVTATGGGSGKFLKETGGVVYLIDHSGTFTGTLTGGTSGATRNIVSVAAAIGPDHELMIYIPNGTSSTIATGIHSSYQGGDTYATNEGVPIGFSFAPEGGFNSALASFDPINQNFWDDITITQSKAAPTLVHRIRQWKTSAASQTIYFIQDDEPGSGFLAWYGRTTASTTDYVNSFIISDNLYDTSIENTGIDKIITNGFMWNELANTTKPKAVNLMRAVSWNLATKVRTNAITNLETGSILSGITAGAFPTFGESIIPTVRAVLHTTLVVPARFHINHLRFIPNNVGHANKFGTDNNYKFIEVGKGYALPWDNFQANPNW